MKIRLHEIELGSGDVQRSRIFYESILGLKPQITIEGLNVFNPNTEGLDFNTSAHISKGITVISFIADNLAEIERRLKEAGVAYEGPSPSHLNMTCIQFKDPDGYLIRVNTAAALANERLETAV